VRRVAGAPGFLPAAAPSSLLGILASLVAWELAARALAGSFLLAGPFDVAAYVAANAGLLGRALRVTLGEAALGFVAGNIAGVALALLALALPRLERGIASLALLFFCLPLIATGPILRVLYGPGIGPQVTLAALAVYYTTFVPFLVGLRAAPAGWFELVRSYGRGRVSELVQVRLPAALPYLVAGLQIAAPAAFLGAMVGEFTGAEQGMGVLAIRAMRDLDTAATWSLALVASAVSMLTYWAIGRIGRLLAAGPPPTILAPPPAPADAPGLRRLAAASLRLAVLASVVLVGWTALMDTFGLNGFFAKRPGDVWNYLLTADTAAEHRATLFAAMAETLAYAVPGYLGGLAAGAGAAMLISVLPVLAASIMPAAIALRSIPIVTTAPLVILVLGRGAVGTVTLVAVMIFFPTLVACLHGLRQTPGQVEDVFASYGAGRVQRLALAQVPAMLPAFFAAARMSVPAAILAVTVVEWLATGSGIGSLMAMTASTSDYGMLWSAVVLVSLAACAWHAGIGALERAVLRRYASEQLA
jgi:sulfonate transport system permease protein